MEIHWYIHVYTYTLIQINNYTCLSILIYITFFTFFVNKCLIFFKGFRYFGVNKINLFAVCVCVCVCVVCVCPEGSGLHCGASVQDPQENRSL